MKKNLLPRGPDLLSNYFFIISPPDHLGKNMRFWDLSHSHMGLAVRKPVLGGLRTTKAQTSLCLCAV